MNIAMVGDEAGVMDIEAQVAPTTDPRTAIGVFDDLLAATPAFSDPKPTIRGWLKTWNGSRGQVSTDIQNVHVAIEWDATWISLYLSRVPLLGTPIPSSSP
jgi:hypothetical protein